ncbi:MAG: hypothetical protein KGS61_12325, partial [Verrucomicrobia bacterium]|nr:hypothetical protein [Verrucomicrobiota bacterium]
QVIRNRQLATQPLAFGEQGSRVRVGWDTTNLPARGKENVARKSLLSEINSELQEAQLLFILLDAAPAHRAPMVVSAQSELRQ